MENQSLIVQLIAAILISSVSGLLGVYLQKLWSSRKPKINIQSIGFHGDIIKVNDTTINLSKQCSWGSKIDGYVSFEGILDYELQMGEYSAELQRARDEAISWIKNNIELKNGLLLTHSALDNCPYLHNPIFLSFYNGDLRRRKDITLPTPLEEVEKLVDIYSIARENEKEIVIHHGWHATRFTIDKDYRDQEKLINKTIAYSILKGESKNIFYLLESFVTRISEDILHLKSLQEELHKTITSNACINFKVAFSNVGSEPHLIMPRSYVELSYGDNKNLISATHQIEVDKGSSELVQLFEEKNKQKKVKGQSVKVESFLDKTDLSPHILLTGNSTVCANYFSEKPLGSSAEQLINFYRIGGLKARLVIWDTKGSMFTSNLTTFTKTVSEEQSDIMKSAANKAIKRN